VRAVSPRQQPSHSIAPGRSSSARIFPGCRKDEANGSTYFDRGQRADVFQILKDHGFNSIRLRVFVDPASPHGYAASSKEPFCDLAHTLVMAKRVHDAGMLLLIDLHYSDTWPTPGSSSSRPRGSNSTSPRCGRPSTITHPKF